MASPTIQANADQSATISVVARIGRIAAPVLALVVFAVLGIAQGLNPAGRAAAAIGTLMAVLWMTEALPLPATSLLPIVLFPLSGVLTIEEATAPYANRYIFLFMGGFMLALGIERWNLHRRIALCTILAVGTKPARLVAGFMIAAAALSMWISNTATAVMMLPIGTSVIALLTEGRSTELAGANASPSHANFGVCLMLGIAYACSIGGLGTLVGTPPNVFLSAFLSNRYGLDLGFARWMCLAVPLVVTYLVIAWLVLTRLAFPLSATDIPGGRALIRGELAKLGPFSRGEWTVSVVFGMTVFAWIARGPLAKWSWLADHFPVIGRLDDTGIAMIAALLLFAIPVDAKRGIFALNWETAKRLPWGVLLLFGGGLCLAAAVKQSKLDQWIGAQIPGPDQLSTLGLILVITCLVIFLTELTSNIATASAFLPILAGLADSSRADPLLFIVPAALAASCAFMLPVATPPNAIVFGSGQVRIAQMVRAGLWLNLVGVMLIPLVIYTLGLWILGVQL